MRQPVFVIGEIEAVSALDAEEIAVRAALVAIVATNDFHASVGAPHAERRLAAVTAVGADRADMLHLPRTRFVPIRARCERAHRADVDAHAALFALQMILFIGCDDGTHAAILYAERPHVLPATIAAHPCGSWPP